MQTNLTTTPPLSANHVIAKGKTVVIDNKQLLNDLVEILEAGNFVIVTQPAKQNGKEVFLLTVI